MRTQKEILKKYFEIDNFYENFAYDNHQIDAIKKTLRWVVGNNTHHSDMRELAEKSNLILKKKTTTTSSTTTFTTSI